jgi:hypothetical protein
LRRASGIHPILQVSVYTIHRRSPLNLVRNAKRGKQRDLPANRRWGATLRPSNM